MQHCAYIHCGVNVDSRNLSLSTSLWLLYSMNWKATSLTSLTNCQKMPVLMSQV